MAAPGDIQLDATQQAVFDEMARAIDAMDDAIALMTRTQDFVNLLMRRAGDAALRDEALGQVSHFFLGVVKAPDLSDEYRIRRLRVFAKATVQLLIEKRVHVVRLSKGPPGLAADN